MAFSEKQEDLKSKRKLTPEQKRAKLLEELDSVRSQLSTAGGEELMDLLEKEEGLETELEETQPGSGTPGTGTSGDASKRMSRGELP